MTLARPDYIEKDAIGRMIALYCKVCGAQIAADRAGGFVRGPNYAELKMQFMDVDFPDFHVTNLCTNCVEVVSRDRTGTILLEMHDADIDMMAEEVPQLSIHKRRASPRVVAVDTKRRGIP